MVKAECPCPVAAARTSSQASAPRASPITTPCGRERSAARISSYIVTGDGPPRISGRVTV